MKVDRNDRNKEKDAHVASLFVTAYDLTFQRPIAFMADRHFQTARVFSVDSVTRPYEEGGFQVLRVGDKAVKWHDEMQAAHTEKFNNGEDTTFNTRHLGDAQLPTTRELTEEFTRYRRSLDNHVNITLADVCRSSAAAPVYLAPKRIPNFYGKNHDLVCCDGGVVANAPAQAAFNALYFEACAEYSQKHQNQQPSAADLDAFDIGHLPNHMVLSIGCGQLAGETEPDDTPNGSLRSYLLNKKNLIDVLMSSNSQLSHVNMEALFASRNAWKNYLRVQMSINENGYPGFIGNETVVKAMKSMDNSSPEVLDVYREAGQYLADVYRPVIRRFVRRMLHTK